MIYLERSLPTINVSAQRFLDSTFVEDTGLPSLVLMEQAAASLTELIVGLGLPGQKVLYLAGAGNNGGDAWASARQLHSFGFDVSVLELFPDKQLTHDAAINKEAYLNFGAEITSMEQVEFSEFDFFVDGIMGTGFNLERSLPKNILKLLTKLNSYSEICRIAIDIPTGIESSSGACDQVVFNADYTVTFSTFKTGLVAEPGSAYSGKIIVAPISMNQDWLEKKLVQYQKENNAYLPRLITKEAIKCLEIESSELDHKGSNGRTLILGGSNGMSGAIILAMRAAQMTGVGYTYLRTVKEILPDLLQVSPESLIDRFPADQEKLIDLLGQADSVALGPGAGVSTWIKDHLELICREAGMLTIDADGLNILAKIPDWYKILNHRTKQGKKYAILTPHPGEFKRLAPGLANLLTKGRQAAAAQLAKLSSSIIVLKGHATVIALPSGQTYINSSGNQSLAKAGSGDVLTGLIAGFSAQMSDPFEATALSVYFHGLLADIAVQKLGIRGVKPSNLPDYGSDAYQILGWIN